MPRFEIQEKTHSKAKSGYFRPEALNEGFRDDPSQMGKRITS